MTQRPQVCSSPWWLGEDMFTYSVPKPALGLVTIFFFSLELRWCENIHKCVKIKAVTQDLLCRPSRPVAIATPTWFLPSQPWEATCSSHPSNRAGTWRGVGVRDSPGAGQRGPAGRLGSQLSSCPQDARTQRQWRTLEAVRHVGVAIVSSALTTVIATVPLFFCIIAPFAKFGKIVALNTGVSILYTLTVSTALLGIMAPSSFTRTRTSFLKALGAVLLAGALGLGACLVLLQSGYKIPLPAGASL